MSMKIFSHRRAEILREQPASRIRALFFSLGDNHLEGFAESSKAGGYANPNNSKSKHDDSLPRD